MSPASSYSFPSSDEIDQSSGLQHLQSVSAPLAIVINHYLTGLCLAPTMQWEQATVLNEFLQFKVNVKFPELI